MSASGSHSILSQPPGTINGALRVTIQVRAALSHPCTCKGMIRIMNSHESA